MLIFLVSTVFLFSCQASDMVVPSPLSTDEPACEWPCTEMDKQTAVAWFETLDAGQTLAAASALPTITRTPIPTQTPIVIPTLDSSGRLPDLIVTEITEPACLPNREGTIIEFNIFVRNIGYASTHYLGRFNVDVFLILGQRHYSLEEWGTVFNGVIGSSNMDVFNLDPEQDIKFTIVIDLLGNKDFGIEVVANAGENPIREADMTNNTLIKYFSAACY